MKIRATSRGLASGKRVRIGEVVEWPDSLPVPEWAVCVEGGAVQAKKPAPPAPETMSAMNKTTPRKSPPRTLSEMSGGVPPVEGKG